MVVGSAASMCQTLLVSGVAKAGRFDHHRCLCPGASYVCSADGDVLERAGVVRVTAGELGDHSAARTPCSHSLAASPRAACAHAGVQGSQPGSSPFQHTNLASLPQMRMQGWVAGVPTESVYRRNQRSLYLHRTPTPPTFIAVVHVRDRTLGKDGRLQHA